jgi:hypothetical protein
MNSHFHTSKAPVIDFFTGQILGKDDDKRLIRLSSEYDGTCMLYSNDANPGRLFKLQLVGWGLQLDGTVVGLVPWLNNISLCPTLTDPLNGHWEGYFNAANSDVFYAAPSHKVAELRAAYIYYCNNTHAYELANKNRKEIVQEIPDHIGTHAVFNDAVQKALHVRAIFSWQLHADGNIEGMIVNPEKIQNTPVLIGDDALYSANTNPNFKYFFQYGIANKIKTKDATVIKAISTLIEG